MTELSPSRRALFVAAGLVLGLVAAALSTEMFAAPSFDTSFTARSVALLAAVVLGASLGAVRSRGRGAWVGGITAAVSAGLLFHDATGWTDLSVFAAGPAGMLAFVFFPATQAVTALVLGSWRSA